MMKKFLKQHKKLIIIGVIFAIIWAFFGINKSLSNTKIKKILINRINYRWNIQLEIDNPAEYFLYLSPLYPGSGTVIIVYKGDYEETIRENVNNFAETKDIELEKELILYFDKEIIELDFKYQKPNFKEKYMYGNIKRGSESIDFIFFPNSEKLYIINFQF